MRKAKFNKTNIEKAITFIRKHNIKLATATFGAKRGTQYCCCPLTAFALYTKEISIKDFKAQVDNDELSALAYFLHEIAVKNDIDEDVLDRFWQGFDGGRYIHTSEYLQDKHPLYRLGREIYLKHKGTILR